MNRMFCMVVAVVLVLAFIAPMAVAANEWTGGQVLVSIANTKPVNNALGVSGTIMYFGNARDNTSMWFAYTGPAWTANSWLWLSPQLGYVGDFRPGKDCVIGALWADVTITPSVVLSIDAEAIGEGGQWDSYHYHQINYRRGGFNLGAHWESANDFGQWGPHAGVTNGPMKYELRYFTGEESHTVRMCAILNF